MNANQILNPVSNKLLNLITRKGLNHGDSFSQLNFLRAFVFLEASFSFWPN